MARDVTVFFYGLFMDPEIMQARGFRPSNIRPAFVDCFGLRLGERATLVPDREGRVYGMLMTLTHDELDAIYSEQSVAAYRPEAVLAELRDGSTQPALCFNLPVIPENIAANRDYASALQAVAKKLGLPESYVASIGN